MIASCGVLGIDWTITCIGEFLEATEAHNAATPSAENDRPEPASPEFVSFMQGRFGRG